MISDQQFKQLLKKCRNAIKSNSAVQVKRCYVKLTAIAKSMRNVPLPKITNDTIKQLAQKSKFDVTRISILMYIVRTILVTLPATGLFIYTAITNPVYMAFLILGIWCYEHEYNTTGKETLIIILKCVKILFTRQRFTRQVKTFLLTLFSFNLVAFFLKWAGFNKLSIKIMLVEFFCLLIQTTYAALLDLDAERRAASESYIKFTNTLVRMYI